jgi:hypothetical protein
MIDEGMLTERNSPDDLPFRDCFLPFFYGPHVLATVTAAEA